MLLLWNYGWFQFQMAVTEVSRQANFLTDAICACYCMGAAPHNCQDAAKHVFRTLQLESEQAGFQDAWLASTSVPKQNSSASDTVRVAVMVQWLRKSTTSLESIIQYNSWIFFAVNGFLDSKEGNECSHTHKMWCSCDSGFGNDWCLFVCLGPQHLLRVHTICKDDVQPPIKTSKTMVIILQTMTGTFSLQIIKGREYFSEAIPLSAAQ